MFNQSFRLQPTTTSTAQRRPWPRLLGYGLGALALIAGCAGEVPLADDDDDFGGTTSGAPAGSGGSSNTTTSVSGSGGATTTGATTTGATTTGATTGTATTTTSSSASSSGSGGGMPALPDPELPGPYSITELDSTTTVAATGHNVAIHAAHPTTGGPYPVVVVGHGFQLPASQYTKYVQHLASFGYVSMTVDFPASFQGNKHTDNAKDLLGGFDWAASALSGIADAQNGGTSGHSLGGKAAILAATMDTRVKATITLDPVDSSMNCSPTDCPDVSAMLPIGIPTAFIGETIDSVGSFMACAPAADNFATFYANAAGPSVQIEVIGANHMSFLDNVATCGLPCFFCNPSQANDATVHKLSKALMVAFYERHLKGISGYQDYLTGSKAQQRYVNTGLAKIDFK